MLDIIYWVYLETPIPYRWQVLSLPLSLPLSLSVFFPFQFFFTFYRVQRSLPAIRKF